MENKKHVLFFAPALTLKGGVAHYSNILIGELKPYFHIHHHMVGDRSTSSFLPVKFLIYPAYDAIRLIFALIEHSYDVIHLNPSLTTYSFLRDSFYLFLVGLFGDLKKTIVFFRGWDSDIIAVLRRVSCLRILFIAYYNRLGRILVLAERFKDELIELGISEERCLVTSTLYKKTSLMQIHPRKSRKVIKILFMSRFVSGKGLDIACQILKYLVDKGYRTVHFVFAGDGPHRTELNSYIITHGLHRNARILGFISGKTKERVLVDCDIFILPSETEGMPNALLEAMGAGQAVIATRVGGIPSVVTDGVNGFLHDSPDVVAFAHSIIKLLDNRRLLRSMQLANREKAERNFEASVVARRMRDIYCSLNVS